MNNLTFIVGNIIFVWFTYSIGANVWEYFEMHSLILLCSTFIINISTWFWLGHYLFFKEKKYSSTQLVFGAILLLVYMHLSLLCILNDIPSQNAFIQILKECVYSATLIFLCLTYPYKQLKNLLNLKELLGNIKSHI